MLSFQFMLFRDICAVSKLIIFIPPRTNLLFQITYIFYYNGMYVHLDNKSFLAYFVKTIEILSLVFQAQTCSIITTLLLIIALPPLLAWNYREKVRIRLTN